MARAAAKRKPPARQHDDAYRKKHKDSGGQRYEETLFFNRLRTHAKWVFVLLIIVFGLGFVLLGVGSGSLGLSDVFSGVGGGGSGTPSIDKPLKRTQENAKDAQAWNDLASAYDLNGDYAQAIPAWETYVSLRPKNVDGLTRLATDYEQQFSVQTNEAALAQAAAASAQPSTFGPPATSPLGRALGSTPDPIAEAAANNANTAFNTAFEARRQTAVQLVTVYKKLAAVQPNESGIQFQLAQAAENAQDAAAAIAAYKQFIKLAPDDLNAPQAKARLKQLQQASGS